jgi:hypothetical protein
VRRDQSDIPVLRALTNSLGAAMWFNCILVLTHANAAPPDNNNGPMTYDVYANQRCHTLQQSIRCALFRFLPSCCSAGLTLVWLNTYATSFGKIQTNNVGL